MKDLKSTISLPFTRTTQYFRNRYIATKITGHDKEMQSFYSQFASKGALVFDIGAHIGNRTRIFLKLGLEVIAIEPQYTCIDKLKTMYGRNKHLTILQNALGSTEGETEMMISNANTLSSLSHDWIDAVKASGRFTEYSWDHTQKITMTTLDKLIDTYGTPSLIKVDVEGFEYEVMKGLSKPVHFISLEFTPEFIDSSYKCIEHLETLGEVLFNYSLGESMKLELDEYVGSKEIIALLESHRHDHVIFGDIYCQFINC